MAGCITLFSYNVGARACWTVPVAMALACIYQMRPLLDGVTGWPRFLGLPPMPTCVVTFRLWLEQAWLYAFKLWSASHSYVKQYMISWLLRVLTGNTERSKQKVGAVTLLFCSSGRCCCCCCCSTHCCRCQGICHCFCCVYCCCCCGYCGCWCFCCGCCCHYVCCCSYRCSTHCCCFITAEC